MIREVDFKTIFEIWRNHLWPNRQSPIEPVSWINHQGDIDPDLERATPKFFAAYEDNHIVGVISGFKTNPTHYRSRGLWVSENQRNKKIGRQLIQTVSEEAKREECKILWSMPRASAKVFYKKCGFHITHEVTKYEFGLHYLAFKNLSS